jgi:hypothetical protein
MDGGVTTADEAISVRVQRDDAGAALSVDTARRRTLAGVALALCPLLVLWRDPPMSDIGGTPGVDVPWQCQIFGPKFCPGGADPSPHQHVCAREPYWTRSTLAAERARQSRPEFQRQFEAATASPGPGFRGCRFCRGRGCLACDGEKKRKDKHT